MFDVNLLFSVIMFLHFITLNKDDKTRIQKKTFLFSAKILPKFESAILFALHFDIKNSEKSVENVNYTQIFTKQ